jgi:hypothetical protein
VFNADVASNLFLTYGSSSSSALFTVEIPPAGYWVMPYQTDATVYSGVVSGVWDGSPTGAAMVTEVYGPGGIIPPPPSPTSNPFSPNYFRADRWGEAGATPTELHLLGVAFCAAVPIAQVNNNTLIESVSTYDLIACLNAMRAADTFGLYFTAD